jgi:hypothetical protein
MQHRSEVVKKKYAASIKAVYFENVKYKSLKNFFERSQNHWLVKIGKKIDGKYFV